MKTQDINNLINNPVWHSYLLHYFLSGAAESKIKKIKFELIYLALPILLDEQLLLELMTKISTSTFSSFFNDKNLELNNRLIGIDKKISDFYEFTNKALIVLGGKVIISSDGYIHTTECVAYKDANNELRNYFKAAYNLGRILAKANYKEVFVKLGSSV